MRRYAWSAKLPLGILTDFEEFAVYDCRRKPNHTDSAATGRVSPVPLHRLPDKMGRDRRHLFARDAVLKGAFDQYAEGIKGKKGTKEVDDAFLAGDRRLARPAGAQPGPAQPGPADVRELNYAVQMTIDRIIFLRICEDRGIEPEDQLQGTADRRKRLRAPVRFVPTGRQALQLRAVPFLQKKKGNPAARTT